MKKYHWPGNVRELRNFVETALILNKGLVVNSSYVAKSLPLQDRNEANRNLPVPLNMPAEQAEREIIYRTLLALKLDITEIKQMLMNMGHGPVPANDYDIDEPVGQAIKHIDINALKPSTMAGMERELIKETLQKFGGSRRKTARALQIGERTLYRKIKEYGL